MKGFTFHAEMPEAMKSKHGNHMFNPWTRATLRDMAEVGSHANVIAVFTDREHWRVERGGLMKECISAIQDIKNSPVTYCAASDEYLRTRTTRIDEATARKLHPALFARLDEATS